MTTSKPLPVASPSDLFVIVESLTNLRGPATGEITLPNRLLWNPSRPFDLSDDVRVRSVLRIVLREACNPEDIEAYVNLDHLIRLWETLGLPTNIKAAWEGRFPELAGNAGKT